MVRMMVMRMLVVTSETGESFIGCDLFEGVRVLGEARLRCGRLRSLLHLLRMLRLIGSRIIVICIFR